MPFRRIDIHAHLNFEDFDADRDAVFERALGAGTAVINVGTDLASSKRSVELAEKYPQGVYSIVGLHPVDSEENFDTAAFRDLAKNAKVVGIGECGLDYFRMKSVPGGEAGLATAKSRQREIFLQQIALANECGKPLMLHIREAYGDALDMLRGHAKVLGNSHFFAGTIEEARGFLDLGYTLSFTGVITFARQYTELVEYVPLDMIQAETDCPFVAPVPYRGQRNEPAYVAEVYAKIARIKKLPVEEVERALLDNARRMWKIGV